MMLFAGCSDDNTANPAPEQKQPEPVTLLAANRNGNVYTVNETTGASTLFLDTWTDDSQGGTMDVGVVSSMVYVATTQKWWMGTGGQASCKGCISTLDPETGEASVLSTDGGQDHGIGVSGLAIHPTVATSRHHR